MVLYNGFNLGIFMSFNTHWIFETYIKSEMRKGRGGGGVSAETVRGIRISSDGSVQLRQFLTESLEIFNHP